MSESTQGGGPDRLRVYQLALGFAEQVDRLLASARCTVSLRRQLERACESIILNIAEGAAHYSSGRKVYHYQTAHGSAHECIAGLQRLRHLNPDLNIFRAINTARMIATMLMALIHTHEARRPD